jgi:hypothetical protein
MRCFVAVWPSTLVWGIARASSPRSAYIVLPGVPLDRDVTHTPGSRAQRTTSCARYSTS